MKSWEIKSFDEDGFMLKRVIIKSDSKYYVKRFGKLFADRTDGSEFTYKEIKNED